ncbi:hypothetical protein ABIA39_002493 [Nocardia sp. GAS34]
MGLSAERRGLDEWLRRPPAYRPRGRRSGLATASGRALGARWWPPRRAGRFRRAAASSVDRSDSGDPSRRCAPAGSAQRTGPAAAAERDDATGATERAGPPDAAAGPVRRRSGSTGPGAAQRHHAPGTAGRTGQPAPHATRPPGPRRNATRRHHATGASERTRSPNPTGAGTAERHHAPHATGPPGTRGDAAERHHAAGTAGPPVTRRNATQRHHATGTTWRTGTPDAAGPVRGRSRPPGRDAAAPRPDTPERDHAPSATGSRRRPCPPDAARHRTRWRVGGAAEAGAVR